MQVSNANLLQYTIAKKNIEAENNGTICSVNINDTEIVKLINVVNKPEDTNKQEESLATNISTLLSNEELLNENNKIIISIPIPKTGTVVRTMSSYRNLPESTVSNIKQIIYDLHHKGASTNPGGGTTTPGGGTTNPDDGTGGTTPGGGTIGDEPELEEPDPTKNSFIEEFNDTTSMFEYISTIDSSVDINKGLTRAQLIALTQREDWEDSNYDFFGSLNRVFNVLDTDSDGVLSFNEIKTFIGDEIGSSAANHMNKVINYANQLQNEFASLSNQAKLNFVLERTEEYLRAVGLTDQLSALNRLKNGNDLYNDFGVGQIGFADLNTNKRPGEPTTLGAYSYFPAGNVDYTYNGKVYPVSIYGHENDVPNGTIDLQNAGLTLDISLLSGTWYNLVDVLVHELTHATAPLWYDTSDPTSTGMTLAQVKKMYDAGMLTTAKYNEIVSKANAGTLTEDDLNHLWYLAACAWGEYAAYQADANYVDSIAGDEFDTGRMTTAVDGPNEKATIENHIHSYYDPIRLEPEPDYKWWTYG